MELLADPDSRTVFAMMPIPKAIQEQLHNAPSRLLPTKCLQQTYKHFGVTK